MILAFVMCRSDTHRRVPRFLALPAAVLALACGNGSPPDDEECRTPRAAFDLHVLAADGALPRDTSVVVRYAGTAVETFSLASEPAGGPKAVFCEPEEAGAGDAGEEAPLVEGIHCALWTAGAAVVTVRSSRHQEAERELVAEADECGIVETISETIVLEPLP